LADAVRGRSHIAGPLTKTQAREYKQGAERSRIAVRGGIGIPFGQAERGFAACTSENGGLARLLRSTCGRLQLGPHCRTGLTCRCIGQSQPHVCDAWGSARSRPRPQSTTARCSATAFVAPRRCALLEIRVLPTFGFFLVRTQVLQELSGASTQKERGWWSGEMLARVRASVRVRARMRAAARSRAPAREMKVQCNAVL